MKTKPQSNNEMKLVIRWRHPSIEKTSLILEGTPEETRSIAEEYFPEEPELITGTQEEWKQEDIDNLPEFES